MSGAAGRPKREALNVVPQTKHVAPELTIHFWRAEAQRLRLLLDEARDPQTALNVPPDPERPPPPRHGRARSVRLTTFELADLHSIYADLLSPPRFAKVHPSEWTDPLPRTEDDVDAFIERRTDAWRKRLARRLERVFVRHDQNERAHAALAGRPVFDGWRHSEWLVSGMEPDE